MSQINEIWLWHIIMCHIDFDSPMKINSTDALRDLPKITKPINAIYKEYQFGKNTKNIFIKKEYSTISPLELVHIDLCGPTKTRSSLSDRYFMLLIDDYSRMNWVTFLKEKSEALDNFKSFKSMVENEMDFKIKFLRSDRGGQLTSS